MRSTKISHTSKMYISALSTPFFLAIGLVASIASVVSVVHATDKYTDDLKMAHNNFIESYLPVISKVAKTRQLKSNAMNILSDLSAEELQKMSELFSSLSSGEPLATGSVNIFRSLDETMSTNGTNSTSYSCDFDFDPNDTCILDEMQKVFPNRNQSYLDSISFNATDLASIFGAVSKNNLTCGEKEYLTYQSACLAKLVDTLPASCLESTDTTINIALQAFAQFLEILNSFADFVIFQCAESAAECSNLSCTPLASIHEECTEADIQALAIEECSSKLRFDNDNSSNPDNSTFFPNSTTRNLRYLETETIPVCEFLSLASCLCTPCVDASTFLDPLRAIYVNTTLEAFKATCVSEGCGDCDKLDACDIFSTGNNNNGTNNGTNNGNNNGTDNPNAATFTSTLVYNYLPSMLLVTMSSFLFYADN